jgi:hypothetical protein
VHKFTEILKSNKYSMTIMLVLHDTNHYRDNTIQKYHIHDTTT